MTDAIEQAVAAAMDGKSSTVEVAPESMPDKKVFDLRTGSDGFDTELDYLIKGYIPSNAFGVVYGPSGSFKSFHAISWAACIATGMSWHDCQVTQGTVIYVVAEGGAGAPRRVKGWEKRYYEGQQIENLLTIRQPVFTGDKEQVEIMICTIQEAEKRTGEKVVLVVLDTLARCFAGADENRTADMNLFIAGCDQIKAATGVTVLVVHHSGKSRTDLARGSSALPSAADFEFRINRPEDNNMAYTLINTKAKDSEEQSAQMFSMSGHFLYTDSDGDDVGTLVPSLTGCAAPEAEVPDTEIKNMSSNHQAVWQAIRYRQARGESTARALILDDLKAQGLSTNNFGRWVDKLIKAGLVIENDDGSLSLKSKAATK